MVFLLYGHLIMNKSDLIDFLGKKFKHLPPREIEKILQKTINLIGDTLSSGGRVEIRGFGTFSITERKDRIGRNPKTGEKIQISKKKTLNFKPSKHMKKVINEK